MPSYFWAGKPLDWENSTVKAALLKTTYTFSPTHTGYAAVSAYEITGTGYTVGGLTVTNPTITYDTANYTATLDCDDFVWDPITATSIGYLVVYDVTNDVLAQCIDLRNGTLGRDVSGGRAEVQLASEGFHIEQYTA